MEATADKPLVQIPEATVLFAGDSGDGMQVTGAQFTHATALARNDLATLPDFPAEIRAPAGTTYGVSGFQLHFGAVDIRTPGDEVDLLVAMNPAALKVNLHRLRSGGSIIVDRDGFDARNLSLAGYGTNPLDDEAFRQRVQLIEVPMTSLVREALVGSGLGTKEVDRAKNMFALGLALWLYSRPLEPALDWATKRFARNAAIRDANLLLLRKGFHYGETVEAFSHRYEVAPATLPPGRYRAIRGAEALAMGLVAAGQQSGLEVYYATYPITPASELLHELSKHKNFGVFTMQAEDEIAAIGAAIGASFGGALGVTGTSGPGMALKTEGLGLAVMTELPLVVVNVQRGGPSTGLPTKTEQSDLLQAVFGRNGEAPLPVLAASTPGDCFEVAYEAARIAVQFMTPVIVLADGYLANGSEPWRIPEVGDLPPFEVHFETVDEAKEQGALAEVDDPAARHPSGPTFLPYRRDPETLSRPWARPGTAGLEHRIGGLEKQHETGNVNYEPENHERMVKLRAEKVQRVRRLIPPTEVTGPESGDVLIVGWGSTRGAIEAAGERLRARGHAVSSIHLRHIWPLPGDLDGIFARFRHLVVPELNNGQLVRLLRDATLRPLVSLPKIQGLPFRTAEIEAFVEDLLTSEPSPLSS
ncbi:MAG TPA: 2-oxoacid:acceptor oxidoreductase subunit alpha [Rhodothermales bacterium]|nr:2-oxoacid:acceptor oxidoreductase subunit alpha [Rhodothermales bacterium]